MYLNGQVAGINSCGGLECSPALSSFPHGLLLFFFISTNLHSSPKVSYLAHCLSDFPQFCQVFKGAGINNESRHEIINRTQFLCLIMEELELRRSRDGEPERTHPPPPQPQPPPPLTSSPHLFIHPPRPSFSLLSSTPRSHRPKRPHHLLPSSLPHPNHLSPPFSPTHPHLPPRPPPPLWFPLP